MPTGPAPSSSTRRGEPSVQWWYAFGAAAAVLGLTPWIATGMRLPLQNLWAAVPPDEMPRVLLPFNQYAITLLLGLIVTGYAIAGLLVRVLGPTRRWSVAAAWTGTAAVQLVAGVQTVATVAAGPWRSRLATVYVLGMVGVIMLANIAGALILYLVGRAPVPGAVVGWALAAIAARWWLTGGSYPLPAGSFPSGASALAPLAVVLPGIVLGAALAWGGWGSRARVTAAVGSVIVVWIVPALVGAVQIAAGYRVYAGHPAELMHVAWTTVGRLLVEPEGVIAPLVALALGVVGAALLAVRRRSRRH